MSEQPLRVGFVGMGIMGGPMAANCLKAGFGVTVFNRSADKTKPLADAGAAVVDSPAAVAAASDIVCSCVPADDDVRQAVLDETTGMIASAREGLIVVDAGHAETELPGVIELHRRLREELPDVEVLLSSSKGGAVSGI